MNIAGEIDDESLQQSVYVPENKSVPAGLAE